MHALRIAGGEPFGAPKGWDPAKEGGDVFVLYVLRETMEGGTPTFTSAWTPTPEELEWINRGGPIFLRVVGAQPPVMVWAQAPAPDEETDELKAQAVLARLEALRMRPDGVTLHDARALMRLVMAGGVDVTLPGSGGR